MYHVDLGLGIPCTPPLRSQPCAGGSVGLSSVLEAVVGPYDEILSVHAHFQPQRQQNSLGADVGALDRLDTLVFD